MRHHSVLWPNKPGEPGYPETTTSPDLEPDSAPQDFPDCVVLMSRSLAIEWVSDHVRGLLGWDPQDLCGIDVHTLVHPDDVLPSHHLATLLAGQPFTWEGRLRSALGDYRATAAVVRPVADARGAVTGVLATWCPAGLATSAEPLVPIVLDAKAASPRGRVVTLAFDQHFVLREVTPHCGFLGWEPDEIIDGYFSLTAMTKEARDSLLHSLLEARATIHMGVREVQQRDGSVVRASFTSRMELDEDGSFAGLRTTWHLP